MIKKIIELNQIEVNSIGGGIKGVVNAINKVKDAKHDAEVYLEGFGSGFSSGVICTAVIMALIKLKHFCDGI